MKSGIRGGTPIQQENATNMEQPAWSSTSTVPPLPLGRYRARFAAAGRVRLGDFPGNAWRGALGHALRRAVCVTRMPECAGCLLRSSCLYPYFFETPPAPDAAKMRRYTTAPHPFVLAPAGGEGFDILLGFTLVGRANRHLPLFVHALGQAAAGERGVAGNRLELVLLEQEPVVGSGTWLPIPDVDGVLAPEPPRSPQIPSLPAGRLGISLRTPLRVKRDGKLVRPEQFRFADLFGNVLRRVSMLIEFHTDATLDADFRGLNDAALAIPAQCELRWQHLQRHSSRQSQSMEFGGLVGSLYVEAEGLANLWPYLWLGQWLHAGTGATMGLGEYRIASLRDAAAPAAGGTMTEEIPCR
jgi:hypothetical protein